MWLVHLVIALVVTLAVPAAGYLMSEHITAVVNADFAASGFPPFDVVCASPDIAQTISMRIYCAEFATLPILRKLSLVAAALGAGIPGVLIVTSVVVGKNRSLLAALFPAVVQFALFMTVVSVLLQGAVLTLGSLVGQAFFLEKVRLYIVAGVGAGALAACWRLFDGILDFGAKLRSTVDGVRVGEERAPGLHAFVVELAKTLGARPPANIVVGLEPNFFVTSAEVVTLDSKRPLDGETLYVSLPLARLMTRDEFTAVVGHELGHFRGADTTYSLKFAPVYAGLASMLAGTSFDKGERIHHGLAKLPARAMLSFMMNVFAMNERAIGREREMLADKAGAEVASPRSLATALIKVGLYAELWDSIVTENVDRLSRGKATRNLSCLLEASVRYDIDPEKVGRLVAEVAKRSIPHPTDTHPPIGRRLKALKVSPASIEAAELGVPDDSAVQLFDNAVALEESLSATEHKRLIDLGLVPQGARATGGAGRHLPAIYRAAIPMIAAHGRVRPDVVRAAETFGATLFPEFDATDFRLTCEYAGDLPEMESLVSQLNEFLDVDLKKAVITWLGRIAGAPGEVGLGEALYIDALATELGFAAGR